MRETSRHLNRILGGAVTFLAAAAILAGCGGSDEDSNQFANEPDGNYPVAVLKAEFEPRQTIAETYDMNLVVRNDGDKVIPALTVSIDLPGKGSTLAFAYRDPEVGLAMPQRPAWVLEEGYPKLAGTVGRGGAGNANRRTFNFGAVKPGRIAKMVWRVTAVRPGNYAVSYVLAAGLSGEAKAVDAAGEIPRGLLPARISAKANLTRIDENGKVVPLDESESLRLEKQEAASK